MTVTIKEFVGQEILDSRGNPTVFAECTLANGIAGSASVPSGASTASAEAVELRDGDPSRYAGRGCRKAAANVSGSISRAAAGRSLDQKGFDSLLIELDGTPNKASLGTNATLAASIAFARAAARAAGVPLFDYFASLAGSPAKHLPRPTVNLFSGGAHAGHQVEVQDLLIVASSAASIDEALEMVARVYRSAATLVSRTYGERGLVADEGGLAPAFRDVTAMLDNAVEAIELSGLRPGEDIHMCVDVASSQFHDHAGYRWKGATVDARTMIEHELGWLRQYPIVSIEDGLAEDDWQSWSELRRAVDGKALIVGDDLLATNRERIAHAIELQAADALLLKPNQVGTLSEALSAYRQARGADWMVTFSARSGETEDSWLADLAVGWSGDQLKVGSITRSERLAKWNRLLSIERTTDLPVHPWPRGHSQ